MWLWFTLIIAQYVPVEGKKKNMENSGIEQRNIF
jgi:hypothetical protein